MRSRRPPFLMSRADKAAAVKAEDTTVITRKKEDVDGDPNCLRGLRVSLLSFSTLRCGKLAFERGRTMTKLVRNHSHWGAFLAEVEDGRVVGVRPFERDPDPSPLIEAMPAAVHSQARIAQPMVREGWLKAGPGHGEGRGREPFVPVSWERALDLVADELVRVKRDHGHDAIMAGSQGWGSAGIFHEARGQLRRFMGTFGGFIDQASNYSFGTALVFLPHVLGSAQACTGPLTSWSSIARHARLMVLFGGANPKNMQVTKGGMRRACHRPVACRARPRRRRGRQCQPDPRRWPGRGGAGMDRDQAQYRHRDAAGAGPHADREPAARRRLPGALLHRLRARARLCDGRKRRPGRRTPTGRRRSPASRPKPSARWRAAWRQTAP